MKLLYLLLVGTCFPALVYGQPTAAECMNLAQSANCSFYTECVERSMPCGPSGYALGYGYHFCKVFGELSNEFTPQGQTWIQNVRRCLINAISIQYQSGANCEQLEESAFNSHPDCYVSNGFCTDILFSVTNLRGLYNVLSTKIEVLFTKRSLKQVIDTATRCASRGIEAIRRFLQSAIEAALNRLFAGFLEDIRDSFSVSCTRDFYIMFVMDSSGSIGSSDFEIMKDFVADVILALNATNGSQIGVIRFSTTPQVVIPLASTHNLNNLAAQVQAIGYIGQNTRTHTALDLMVEQLVAASAEGAIPVGILLTDGQSSTPELTLEAAARVHAAGISMYTFGIGDTDQDELQAIASSPFYDYSFYISSFNTAEFEERVLLLTRQTCSTPESRLLDEASTHSLAQGDKAYITYPFDTEEGVTLQYQVEEGALNVFGSFSVRNPTQSTADFAFTANLKTTYYFVSPDKYDEATGKLSTGRSARQVQSIPGNATASNVTLFTTVSGLNDINDFTITTVLGEASGTNGAVRVTFSVVLMAVFVCIMM